MCKIALIGAGAVGGYFIWGFHEDREAEFTLIAEGERLERLKSFGVRINGRTYFPEVKPPEEAGEQDVVLVATKYGGLESAIEMLDRLTGSETIVLSLLNGVDSEERIAEKVGWEHVDYSVMRIASVRNEKGIWFEPEVTGGLYVGAGKLPEKVLRFFTDSKIHFTVEEDILRDLWIKYASNIANNLPQAILGTDASLYTDSVHGRFLAERLWEEVYQVAMKKGIDIGKELLVFPSPKTSRYSTLQDIEAGRHTEVDIFSGTVIRLAEKEHIHVPYNEFAFHAIKALEEKNDGIIGR